MWRWFDELDAARTGNGWAANAITFTEINAWASLYGLTLRSWEVRALRAMDAVRLSTLAQDQAAPEETIISERPLTPELFDALFP